MKVEISKQDGVATVVVQPEEMTQKSLSTEEIQKLATQIGSDVKQVVLDTKNATDQHVAEVGCLIRLLTKTGKEVELRNALHGLMNIPSLIDRN